MGLNDYTDNLTYGTGANNGTISILEASTYEVPVNSSASAGAVTRQAVRTAEPEYDLTESTYAVPNVYEYATLGPNEQMVMLIQLTCTHSLSSSKSCVVMTIYGHLCMH